MLRGQCSTSRGIQMSGRTCLISLSTEINDRISSEPEVTLEHTVNDDQYEGTMLVVNGQSETIVEEDDDDIVCTMESASELSPNGSRRDGFEVEYGSICRRTETPQTLRIGNKAWQEMCSRIPSEASRYKPSTSFKTNPSNFVVMSFTVTRVCGA